MAYSSVSISRSGDAEAARDTMPTPPTIERIADADTFTLLTSSYRLTYCHRTSVIASSDSADMSMRIILSIEYGSRAATSFAPLTSEITITLTS